MYGQHFQFSFFEHRELTFEGKGALSDGLGRFNPDPGWATAGVDNRRCLVFILGVTWEYDTHRERETVRREQRAGTDPFLQASVIMELQMQ